MPARNPPPQKDPFGGEEQAQAGFSLDDGNGLRVVSARFLGDEKFSRELFSGYDTLRVLTYSASAEAIVRLLDEFPFKKFECIFGYEGVLQDIKHVLSFQKVVIGNTRAAIMGLKDERHVKILERVHSEQARFYVLRKHVAHAKLFLLSVNNETRVIVGSANLSERAFSGNQPETLIKFDNDVKAWQHYSRMFDVIKDAAADEIPLPDDRITHAEIEISETPVITASPPTLVIETPPAEIIEVSAPVQINRVEKVLAVLAPRISAALPAVRNFKQTITPEIKREISRIQLVKTVEQADNRYFTVDRVNRTANLSGKEFPLEADESLLRKDAGLLSEYFRNYDGAFEGNVPRLQRDYFVFMSWLYFSPFICDMRSLALLQDSDVIRFPSFAVIFGKSNCGKTCLVDTLLTSMFGFAHTIEKAGFTAAQLRGLQASYRRFPVVFDDIGKTAFMHHGRDMIKNEMQPPVTEYPSFILSMNAEPQSFPDEVVKRSLMIYAATALPPYNEGLRQSLQAKIQEMRRSLTGHFYRRYLIEVMEILEKERLPHDWLELSSRVLSNLLDAAAGTRAEWYRPITWLNYAEKRYDRVKARLDNLLRPSAFCRNEGEVTSGWKLEGGRVIVWQARDAFGRREFEFEDVPSTLIEEEISTAGRTVLHRARVEEFIGRRLRSVKHWWLPWSGS